MKEFAQMGRTISEWYQKLEPIALADLLPDEESARRTTVFSTDMINGFCKEGNLASPRIDAIARPIAGLFTRMHDASVGNFVLIQEWHDPEAKEFLSFPAHGVRETEEAETISELTALPFANKFVIFRKNSISPAWAQRERGHEPHPYTHPVYPGGYRPLWQESFERYLEDSDIMNAVFVGNCTDLCLAQGAMYVKLRANEQQKDVRVIVPTNCVATFDMPFALANEIGAMPHPGDMYHRLALYEMARNGIEIVREIV